MKKLLIALSLVLSVFTLNVKAEVKATNLKEVVKEEYELVKDNKQYSDYAKIFKNFDEKNYDAKSKDAKVTVYVFRGSTCSHCLEAMAYFASMYPKYDSKIDIITYETWGNKDNQKLLDKLGEAFNEEISGVPYIVIGEETFPGYSESMNKDIVKAIDNAYNDEEYKDVVSQVKDGTYEAAKEPSDLPIIIGIFVIVFGGCGLLVYFSRKTND